MDSDAQSRVLTYLSLFNEIDKHFDTLLKIEGFLPYNDKLKQIIQGKYPISWFVRLFQQDLKYFGELRNHISHGMKLNEVLYALPTQQAIDKLQDFVDKIVTPPLTIDFFRKEVVSIQISASVFHLLATFKETHYSSMPVYDQKKFLGVITERGLLRRMSEQMLQENFVNLQKYQVSALPIYTGKHDYVFVSSAINIYETDEIFTKRRQG